MARGRVTSAAEGRARAVGDVVGWGSYRLGRICGAGFIPASEGGVGPQRPPTRRRPAYSRPPQGVRGAGAGPCGWEESVGPGLSRPAEVGWTAATADTPSAGRSEEHTSELQSRENLVCRLLLEKK